MKIGIPIYDGVNVLDVTGLDPKSRERLYRIERELAASYTRFLFVEAGIDQNMAATTPDQPHKIVEICRRGLVRVRRDVIHVGGTR